MKSSSVAGAAVALRCCCMPPPLAKCRELAESVLPRESICVGKSNGFKIFSQLFQLFSATFLTIFCFVCAFYLGLLSLFFCFISVVSLQAHGYHCDYGYGCLATE